MPRIRPQLVGLLGMMLLAVPAEAQEMGVHWQQDIETAKATARQTGRLVLVHVWSDGCVPCRALEQNVFNQPGFASALEAQFIPVKLNANEYPGIAQGFGITRVPTDVILTPDGQVLSKGISPTTPSAYLAEVGQVSNQYLSQSGHAFQNAVAAAPMPPVLNSAYASLQIGQPTLPPASPSPVASPPALTTSMPALSAASGAVPLAQANDRYATAGTPAWATQPASGPIGYATTTPSNTSSAAPAAVAPIVAPIQTTNPYASAYAPAATPSPTTPIAAPAQRQPITPIDFSVPPANSGGVPTSAEASQSRPAMQPNYAATVAPNLSAPANTTTATTATTLTNAPDARQLPAGAPPLAFDGYCPVSMRAMWKWVPGDARYGAIHRGRTYWFAGPKEQQQFLANPDYYSPALSGLDPVMALDHKQSIPGVREHSLDYDNQFYMFSSEATLQQFSANPERYANGVRQAMGLPAGPPVVR
ncbi:MAG TPA: thioredoxin family protein [Lacipirellulaceae bacterium]